MSNSSQKPCRKTHAAPGVGRYATICMGSGGIVWAKPPNAQCIDCLAFEDLLRVALWLRFGSAQHDER
eukprot:3655180-Amphidinium_carterae.1